MNEHSLTAIGLAAADQIVKTTLILALAWLAARLLRRRSAAARHLVWTAAFVVILLMPTLEFVSPIRMPLVVWRPPGQSFAPAGQALAGEDLNVRQLPPRRYMQPAAAPRAIGGPPTRDLEGGSIARLWVPLTTGNIEARQEMLRLRPLPRPAPLDGTGSTALALLLAVALCGTVLGVVRALVAVGSLARVRYGRSSAAEISAAERRELSLASGLSREWNLRVASCGWVRAAMTWGVLHPVVLLPDASGAWAADRRRIVLLHELAHVRRLDSLSRLLTLLVGAIYWFHPAVWFAARALRAEAETAADDAVLRGGIAPSAYAAELLRIAAELGRSRRPFLSLGSNPIGVSVMNESKIETRIRAILNPSPTRRRTGATRTEALAIVGIAALLALPLAAANARQQTSDPAKKPVPAASPKAVIKPTATPPKQSNEKAGGQIMLIRVKEPLTTIKSRKGAVYVSSKISARMVRVKNPVIVIDRNGKSIAVIQPGGSMRFVDVEEPTLIRDRRGEVIKVRVLGSKPIVIDQTGAIKVIDMTTQVTPFKIVDVTTQVKPLKVDDVTAQVKPLLDVKGEPVKVIVGTSPLKPVIRFDTKPLNVINVTTQVKPLTDVNGKPVKDTDIRPPSADRILAKLYVDAKNTQPVTQTYNRALELLANASSSQVAQAGKDKAPADTAETRALLQELKTKLERLQMLHDQGFVAEGQLQELRAKIGEIIGRKYAGEQIILAPSADLAGRLSLLSDLSVRGYVSKVELLNLRTKIEDATALSATNQASVAADRANFDSANVQSRVARDDFDRVSQLYKAGVIDQGQLDAAELRVREAQAQLDAAVAALRAAKAGKTSSIQVRTLSAQAQLDRAQAEYAYAQKEAERLSRSYKIGIATKSDADVARARLDVARAELELAKKLLDLSRTKK